jgi:hypothetical protein
MWAIVAFALGFFLRLPHGETALAAIGCLGDSFKPVADWIAAHGDWFDRASGDRFATTLKGRSGQPWRSFCFHGAREIAV